MTITKKSDVKIHELVNSIERKELMLPKMQRRYVWRGTRVRDLLDSLYRGYPSGSILVWDNYNPELSRGMDVEQTGDNFNERKLLLDGQQRLTSLSAVLRGTMVNVRGRRRPIDILFNLDHPDGLEEFTEVDNDDLEADEASDELEEQEESVIEKMRNRTFVVASKAMAHLPNWVSVTEVFKLNDTNAFLQKLGITSLTDPRANKYTKRLQALQNIKDYYFTVNTISRDVSYEEVAEIFVRINSLGVKLRGSDLALALITAKWPESLDLLEKFQEECEESSMTIDLGLLVRTLVVFATDQSRFTRVSSLSLDALKEAWKKAQAGINFTINFLKENAQIEDETLLSSPLFFTLISYYSQVKKESFSDKEVKDLLYWLYVASAKGRYSRGSTETLLDADLRTISKGGGAEEMIETLRQQFGRLEFETSDFAGRGFNSPLFSLVFIALRSRGATDWNTGINISTSLQGGQHKIQYHHIFPKSLLKNKYERREINEISNMAFVSGRTNRRISNKYPEIYLADLIKDKGERNLLSQGVPTDTKFHKIENYSEFLTVRRENLCTIVKEFLASIRESA